MSTDAYGNLYILDLADDQVHEDDAAMELATVLSGPGVTFSGVPREGVKIFNPLKIRLIITGDEVFKGLIKNVLTLPKLPGKSLLPEWVIVICPGYSFAVPDRPPSVLPASGAIHDRLPGLKGPELRFPGWGKLEYPGPSGPVEIFRSDS